MSKIQEETIKTLMRDIKFYEKLLNNVFNWCDKDSILYWNITRNRYKGDNNE